MQVRGEVKGAEGGLSCKCKKRVRGIGCRVMQREGIGYTKLSIQGLDWDQWWIQVWGEGGRKSNGAP